MNGVQTRFKCKLDVKRCKRFVFPPSSLLPRSNALKTKAIRYFQTDRTLTRIVSPPLHPRKETTSTVNPTDNYYNSWRIYRYADVLLLAVELDVRINGTASADAQGWFDQVRDRAFKDKEHRINLAGKSKQELLDILFEERGYEFMDEMQRWFDILRFDKGTEILGNKGWTEKFRYFPIDQSEMDRAKGGLTQNPGWL